MNGKERNVVSVERKVGTPLTHDDLDKIYSSLSLNNSIITELRRKLFPQYWQEIINPPNPTTSVTVIRDTRGWLDTIIPMQLAVPSNITVQIDRRQDMLIPFNVNATGYPYTDLHIRFFEEVKVTADNPFLLIGRIGW